MFKYYKNLVNFISMFSWVENLWWDLQQEKQKLIDTVNSIDLTQKQLNKIKQELISNGKTINGFTLQNWRDNQISMINSSDVNSTEDITKFNQKYTKLQNEITKESGVSRNKLAEEIPLINADQIKKMKPTTLPSETPSQTTPEVPLPTPEKTTNSLNINIKNDWVKNNLKSHFGNMNNPTKDEVLKVLNDFKGFDTIKDWSSASVIYAIQVALNKVWIPLDVDWVYKDSKTGKSNTKNAIAQFQSEQMHLGRTNWNPWPKTMKALIEKYEKANS